MNQINRHSWIQTKRLSIIILKQSVYGVPLSAWLPPNTSLQYSYNRFWFLQWSVVIWRNPSISFYGTTKAAHQSQLKIYTSWVGFEFYPQTQLATWMIKNDIISSKFKLSSQWNSFISSAMNDQPVFKVELLVLPLCSFAAILKFHIATKSTWRRVSASHRLVSKHNSCSENVDIPVEILHKSPVHYILYFNEKLYWVTQKSTPVWSSVKYTTKEKFSKTKYVWATNELSFSVFVCNLAKIWMFKIR